MDEFEKLARLRGYSNFKRERGHYCHVELEVLYQGYLLGHRTQQQASAAQSAPDGYVLNIQVEKLLCKKLGIEWAPTGMSIVSLVDQLAQRAQSAPAECTNEDSWNCKYCRKTETCAALKDDRNFGSPQPAAPAPETPQ